MSCLNVVNLAQKFKVNNSKLTGMKIILYNVNYINISTYFKTFLASFKINLEDYLFIFLFLKLQYKLILKEHIYSIQFSNIKNTHSKMSVKVKLMAPHLGLRCIVLSYTLNSPKIIFIKK